MSETIHPAKRELVFEPTGHGFRYFWSLLRETGIEWFDDNASMLGAALAYYSIFSLGPLILLVLALLTPILGEQQVRDELLARMGAVMGSEHIATIGAVLEKAGRLQGRSTAAFFSVTTLIVSGSVVLMQLRTAMNIIWNVRPEEHLAFKTRLFRQLKGVVAVFFVAMVLLLSLILTTTISLLDRYLFAYLPASGFILHGANFTGLFLVEMSVFILLFKWFPDTPVRWKEVILGAAVTTVLFELGKTAISLYLSHQGFESTFGAAGAVVGMMFWIYYSAQIMFFGAEFTQVHARHQRKQQGSPLLAKAPSHGNPT